MRIMGNLYTDNLIGTVIGLSVADDWEGARREWEIVGCEVDETHSATCVCGKEGLRYVYTIANTETGETLSPIGSSCIKKFEQSDMDEELAGWQQAIKLMEEAARIEKRITSICIAEVTRASSCTSCTSKMRFDRQSTTDMMVITTTYSCLTCSTEDSVRKRRRENAKLSSCNPSTHG